MQADSPRFWTPSFDIEKRADGSLIMAQRGALPTPPRALPDRLVHWAATTPEQPYLAARNAAGGWEILTYAATLAKTRALGAGLLAQGLGPDRPLLILSENSLNHALLGLAAQYVGVPYAPVSPPYALISSDHAKLKQIVALLRPGLLFAEDGAVYAKALDAIAAPGHAELTASAPRRPGGLTVETLASLGQPGAADAAFQRLTGDTVAKYLFTSGSTGAPKAVINTQRMLCANQAMVADCFRFFATAFSTACR